ncbi:MAG TPA: PAS domain S-box protein [Pyrinomonadaceae bacterium]
MSEKRKSSIRRQVLAEKELSDIKYALDQSSIVAMTDHTERVNSMAAHHESEERLRRMIEHSSYGKLLMDQNGTIQLINREIEKQFGFSREEMLGKNIELLIPHDSRPRSIRLLRKFISNPSPRTMGSGRELYGLRSDGSQFPVEIGLNPLPSEPGIMVLVTVTDITERKQAEIELRRSEGRYRELFDNNPLPMWVYDADTLDFLAVNQATCRQYGYSRDEFLSMKLIEIRPDADVPLLLENVSSTTESLQKSGDWRHRRKDDSILFVEISSHELSFAGRKSRLVLANDVTDRRRAEMELRGSEERYRELASTLERRVAERTVELESVNKELEAFAYSVSHDLRAPLRAMDGFSLALLEDYAERLDGTGKNFLDRIRNASQQMSRLIDDLLSLSRVTRSDIHYAEVNLSSIAKEIVNRYQELQPRKDLVVDMQDGVKVRGDERLLRIALENLLSNAWKFTSKIEDPLITFTSAEHDGSIVHCVADNGAGFDMRFADKLFGAFQRLHSANEFEGTGIGLATVQRIINRHGGRIWADSGVSKGAAFYFTI